MVVVIILYILIDNWQQHCQAGCDNGKEHQIEEQTIQYLAWNYGVLSETFDMGTTKYEIRSYGFVLIGSCVSPSVTNFSVAWVIKDCWCRVFCFIGLVYLVAKSQ